MKFRFNLILSILFSIILPSASAQHDSFFEMLETNVNLTPAVMAAQADIVRADATGDTLKKGPYEFQFNISGGTRTVKNPMLGDDEYDEWTGGASRTIRLPNKYKLDRSLAEIELQLAEAVLQKTQFEQSLSLISSLLSWRQAERLAENSVHLLTNTEQLMELEHKKVKNGSGRQIDADQLTIETEMMRLQVSQDQLQERTSYQALQIHYPAIDLSNQYEISIDDYQELTNLDASEIILPVERLARLTSIQADLRAQRLRADRLADPTIGLEASDEFGGSESSIRLTLSIPFGGSKRRAMAREASARSTVATYAADAATRADRQQLESLRQNALLSCNAFTSAQAVQTLSEKSLNQLQAAFKIGAISLNDLTLAQRKHQQMVRSQITQQSQCEESYLALRVVLTSLL